MMQESGKRTRVKICGLTREEDVLAAVDAGADAIGLVCYEGSKRYVSPEQAERLRRCVPPFVSLVTLFVNAKPHAVRAVIDRVQPDLLQFHGDESARECEQYDRPYLRALRVGGAGMDAPHKVWQACAEFPLAQGWLFDSYTQGYGGSGQAFDYALLEEVIQEERCLILSGGLNATNVGQAMRAVRPWAVDVSSGVETAPGIKSAEKIRAFMLAVAQADRET